MRTIKGQTISSTVLDLHGEKLTRARLTSLFNQMPAIQVVNQDHDLAKPIIAKVYNKQLVEIENGELAIKVDVDVLNEEEFAKRSAFSISYGRRHYTVNSHRIGEIKIVFNSRLVNEDEIFPLLATSDELVQVDAEEMAQKGLETVAILVLVFVTQAVASGFFEEPGADAYKRLKLKLKQLAERHRSQRKPELKCNFSFKASVAGLTIDVIIESDTDCLSIICRQSIAIEPLLDQVLPYAQLAKISRVTLRISEAAPYLQVVHVVDEDGRMVNVVSQISE